MVNSVGMITDYWFLRHIKGIFLKIFDMANYTSAMCISTWQLKSLPCAKFENIPL